MAAALTRHTASRCSDSSHGGAEPGQYSPSLSCRAAHCRNAGEWPPFPFGFPSSARSGVCAPSSDGRTRPEDAAAGIRGATRGAVTRGTSRGRATAGASSGRVAVKSASAPRAAEAKIAAATAHALGRRREAEPRARALAVPAAAEARSGARPRDVDAAIARTRRGVV